MADKLAWFPFYCADYLLDDAVDELTLEQEGAFLRLLCHQWREGSIAADEASLRKKLKRCDPRKFRSIWSRLSVHFEPISDGRLINPKLNSLRVAAMDESRKQAKRAKDRWDRVAPAYAEPGEPAMRSDTESDQKQIEGEIPHGDTVGGDLIPLLMLADAWGFVFPGPPPDAQGLIALGAKLESWARSTPPVGELRDWVIGCLEAWKRLVDGWRRKKVHANPTPWKMGEHLATIDSVLKGQIVPEDWGKKDESKGVAVPMAAKGKGESW